jgi:hypothetical protein
MRSLRNSPASIHDNRWRATPLVLCMSILVSCSQSKTLTAEDMKSELASAVSLASETEMFIEQWQEDLLTPSFIKAHLGYLQQETRSSIEELEDTQAEPSVASKAENCRTQLKALQHEFRILRTDADSYVRPLRIDCQRIEQIRKSLEDSKSMP